MGELKVDGEVNDKLVVGASETKTFEIEVINKNNRQARFNFYYKGSLPDNVEAGYVEGDGYNPMVKETGVILTANGSLGYFLKYQIKVKNSTTGSITISLGYEVGLDYNNLSLPSNCYLFDEAKSNTAIDVLLTNYTNSESTQDYNINYTKTDTTAKENKMYVFDHASSKGSQQSDWNDDELKDYRYIGANPNNYVLFNEEMWRIIGIETVDDGEGKREKRIKLIRKDPLTPDMSWDNKPSGTGSSESSSGSNDWTDARLMMILNPGYDEEANATGGKGSLYWNRQSGSCPKGSSGASTTCNFEETGLLPEAQAMIGDAKWYLGGNSTASGVLTEAYYKFERSETVYSSSAHPRKTSWKGKVGLMYPSDYGYATSGGATANRATCLAKALYNWDTKTDGIPECKDNDWIFNSQTQWTIAPYSGSSSGAFSVYDSGYVYSRSYFVYAPYGVRPVVYLKASTLYESGDGSESNPFVFTSDPNVDEEAPVCKLTSSSVTTDASGSQKGGEGTFIIECTDNSGTLKNDLTSDSINFGYIPCELDQEERSYNITANLSNTETITGGKRYTFTMSSDNNTSWFNHCNEVHFMEIKGGSISDNSNNQNEKSRFEFEVSVYYYDLSPRLCEPCGVVVNPEIPEI